MMTPPFTLITRKQAADFLSISEGTLDKLIRSGVLPDPLRLGSIRLQYWRSQEFYAAIDRQLLPDARNRDTATANPSEPRR